MKNIITGIRRYWPVSDASLQLLFDKMIRLELPKKHLLIQGGECDLHLYFIEKGFARSYCLHEGKEVTRCDSPSQPQLHRLLLGYYPTAFKSIEG